MVINRSQEKLQGDFSRGGIMIGCICRLQVDSSIAGGVACVAGEGIWGRDRALEPGREEGNAFKEAIVFAIPPTNSCKNNAKR